MARGPVVPRKALRAELETNGYGAAVAKWPHAKKLVTLVARTLGFLPTYHHEGAKHAAWNSEWVKLLGTKPDHVLAALLGVSGAMISMKRYALGIPPCTHTYRAALYEKQLAELTDVQLADTLHAIHAHSNIPIVALTAERRRRGLLVVKRGSEHTEDRLMLFKRAAIAGMTVAGANQVMMGKVLHLSPERVRQLFMDVRSVFSQSES